MPAVNHHARGLIAGIAAMGAAISLPMVGGFASTAAADSTLTLFEHDTQQTMVDLGDPGPGPGDEFLFAGDVFDRAGGTNLGHTAGKCTTVSGAATGGDMLCQGTFDLAGGELAIQGLAGGEESGPGPVAIVGGTGIYANARGDGSIEFVQGVPNDTDSNFVLNVITG